MPRKSRIDTPGALHHIIGRGINRQEIFADKKDYSVFLERLGDLLSETKTSCYAWALIPNHFHLLLRTGDVPISALMKRLLTGYAINYNRRHNRSGHLFQNRYKSILCQEDPYLLELVRYIHLNPLRAKLVSEYRSLAAYPYCGHGVIMGRRKINWQDTDYVLQLFGNKESGAKGKYSQFVRNGIERGSRPDLTGGGLLRSHGGWAGIKLLRDSGDYQKGDERILGNGIFVKEVLDKAEEKFKDKYRLKAEGYDLDKLIGRIAEITHLTPEQILDTIRDAKRTKARSILCFWATDKLGVSQSQLALLLKLTQSAISHAVRRGRDLVEDNLNLIDNN
ncbi:MAG TPA: transposase [Desulfatiglandales bacterium]|nr:transposase [Desulfatiglandales bacterium]